MKRRDFLKLSTTGFAGAIFTRDKFTLPGQGKKEEFIYRELGNTGLKLPIISIGKLPIENKNLVKAIFNSGVVHIDSAHGYHDGKNDSMIGEMLKTFDRDRYILSTKVSMPYDRETRRYKSELSTEDFINEFIESIDRQGVEYVDILYLHMPPSPEAALDDRMLAGLRKLKETGKAKYLGLSTHSNMPEMIQAAMDGKIYEVVLTTYNYQINSQDIEEKIKKACDQGLGVIAMKTQAGKFLDKERTRPVDSSAAIKWSLQNPNITTALVSVKTFEDLKLYKELFRNIELTESEKDFVKNNQDTASLFCKGCEECVNQCQKGLPLPDIMRAYMYCYGYRALKDSRELLASLNLPDDACEECNSCSVHCSSGFNLATKVRDIQRLVSVPPDFIA